MSVPNGRDGGPAFPNITPDMNVDGGPGMSLKDYFAGQALPVVYAAGTSVTSFGPTITEIAEKAYQIAEAMLEARKR